MKRTTAILGSAVAVGLLALGGCGKKSGGGDEVTSVAVVKPAVSPSLTPPSRKPGLWEQKISTAGMNQTIKMCLDEAVEQKMKWWGSQAGNKSSNCEQEAITPHAGGGWDFHAVCRMGESGTIISDGSATGDFSSHYKVEIKSVTSGSPMAQANGPHVTAIEATWTGPCPADMKAGDMLMPGGMKFNAADSMSGKPPVMPGGADMAKLRAQAKAMAAAARHEQ